MGVKGLSKFVEGNKSLQHPYHFSNGKCTNLPKNDPKKQNIDNGTQNWLIIDASCYYHVKVSQRNVFYDFYQIYQNILNDIEAWHKAYFSRIVFIIDGFHAWVVNGKLSTHQKRSTQKLKENYKMTQRLYQYFDNKALSKAETNASQSKVSTTNDKSIANSSGSDSDSQCEQKSDDESDHNKDTIEDTIEETESKHDSNPEPTIENPDTPINPPKKKKTKKSAKLPKMSSAMYCGMGEFLETIFDDIARTHDFVDVISTTQEADAALAAYVHQYAKRFFGIVTNDSDFYIFDLPKHCAVIPIQSLTRKSGDVKLMAYYPTQVWSILGLTTLRQKKLFAQIKGCDLTNVGTNDCKGTARYIRRNESKLTVRDDVDRFYNPTPIHSNSCRPCFDEFVERGIVVLPQRCCGILPAKDAFLTATPVSVPSNHSLSKDTSKDATTLSTAHWQRKDTSTDTPKDVSKDISDDTPKDISNDTPKDAPKDITDDTSNDISNDASTLSTAHCQRKDTSTDTPKDASKDISTDTPDERDDAPKDIPDDTAKDISDDASKDTPKDVSTDMSKYESQPEMGSSVLESMVERPIHIDEVLRKLRLCVYARYVPHITEVTEYRDVVVKIESNGSIEYRLEVMVETVTIPQSLAPYALIRPSVDRFKNMSLSAPPRLLHYLQIVDQSLKQMQIYQSQNLAIQRQAWFEQMTFRPQFTSIKYLKSRMKSAEKALKSNANENSDDSGDATLQLKRIKNKYSKFSRNGRPKPMDIYAQNLFLTCLSMICFQDELPPIHRLFCGPLFHFLCQNKPDIDDILATIKPRKQRSSFNHHNNRNKNSRPNYKNQRYKK